MFKARFPKLFYKYQRTEREHDSSNHSYTYYHEFKRRTKGYTLVVESDSAIPELALQRYLDAWENSLIPSQN